MKKKKAGTALVKRQSRTVRDLTAPKAKGVKGGGQFHDMVFPRLGDNVGT